LSSTSIFLSLKNELKIFLSIETYGKGRPDLKVTVYEHTTILKTLCQKVRWQYGIEKFHGGVTMSGSRTVGGGWSLT